MLFVRIWRRRSRPRGFTLPELLTVVAITGVLAAVAILSLTNAGKAQNAASLARSIHLVMQRARAEALADGSARRISCTPAVTDGGCRYAKATAKGSAPAAFVDQGDDIHVGANAWIWNITSTPNDSASHAGTTQTTTTVNITFYPTGIVTTGGNGTATGATLFVSDKTSTHRYKISVYGGTGLSHLVDTW